jgi:hypothetical protein
MEVAGFSNNGTQCNKYCRCSEFAVLELYGVNYDRWVRWFRDGVVLEAEEDRYYLDSNNSSQLIEADGALCLWFEEHD